MLNSFNSNQSVNVTSGIGLYKSNPLSYIVENEDIRFNSDTFEYEWIIWNSYNCGRIYRTEKRRIPVVVLQVVTVGSTIMAEVMKKTDYNNQVFELKRNI